MRASLFTLLEDDDNIPDYLERVPGDSFYTRIVLLDGVTPGQEEGGYIPHPSATLINIIGLDTRAFQVRHKRIIEGYSVRDVLDCDHDYDKFNSIIAYT